MRRPVIIYGLKLFAIGLCWVAIAYEVMAFGFKVTRKAHVGFYRLDWVLPVALAALCFWGALRTAAVLAKRPPQ
jgi:hypothetical protein